MEQETNLQQIKHLQFMENQLLVSSGMGFCVYDVRNMKELAKADIPDLRKAVFSPCSAQNVFCYTEESSRLQIWNLLKL